MFGYVKSHPGANHTVQLYRLKVTQLENSVTVVKIHPVESSAIQVQTSARLKVESSARLKVESSARLIVVK